MRQRLTNVHGVFKVVRNDTVKEAIVDEIETERLLLRPFEEGDAEDAWDNLMRIRSRWV